MDWLMHLFCPCHGTGPAIWAAIAAGGGGLAALVRRLRGMAA